MTGDWEYPSSILNQLSTDHEFSTGINPASNEFEIADLIVGETLTLVGDDQTIDAGADDSKPFFKEGQWRLNYWQPDGTRRTVTGKVQPASRCQGRSVLSFNLGNKKSKKYYLCEFCSQKGDVVWIFYRNYIAQHVPRHHPNECKVCDVCRKLIYRPLIRSHSRICLRHKQQKRRESRSTDFVELEYPNERYSDEYASDQADKLEQYLSGKGFKVALGNHGEHQVGYPVQSESKIVESGAMINSCCSSPTESSQVDSYSSVERVPVSLETRASDVSTACSDVAEEVCFNDLINVIPDYSYVFPKDSFSDLNVEMQRIFDLSWQNVVPSIPGHQPRLQINPSD